MVGNIAEAELADNSTSKCDGRDISGGRRVGILCRIKNFQNGVDRTNNLLER